MKRFKELFLFIIVVSLFSQNLFSQTSISEVINKYAVIDSIYPDMDTITVSNHEFYSAGDTVMLYQAKGADVDLNPGPNPYLLGSIDDYNSAGRYEIVIIREKTGLNEIVLRNKLINNYNTNYLVQLIRVPSYSNVIVSDVLTCDPWDGEKGGILAFMVSDTLFLDADIDVSGKGFMGADSLFFDNSVYSNCARSDSALYVSYSFPEIDNTVSAGLKGESIALFNTDHRKGRGMWANGGGGGNGRFSGGGGGSNLGTGAKGGAEDTTFCDTISVVWKDLGGLGSYSVNSASYSDSILFLGGGGGSGTYTSGLLATKGANGGGVVFIIAKNIKSNGHQIIADGGTVTNIATASAGGGGGGGVVVFDIDTVFGNIDVSAKGGDGGFVQSTGKGGPGGGGGGGIIFWNSVEPLNVDANVSGGGSGYVNEFYPGVVNPYYAGIATFGRKNGVSDNVEVLLNGFLFNKLTAKEEICMEDRVVLYGTQPRGGYGEGTYTFKWVQSTDGSNWEDTIVGATSNDYITDALTDTMYYKRIVFSGDIKDEGLSIKINVQDSIENNVIVGDDLISCLGNPADTITGTIVTVGGDYNNYNYTWQYRLDFESSWTNLNSKIDTCLPGIVQDTTFIRRIVSSSACFDTVNLVPEIIGLPQITNNVITENQEICDFDIPAQLIGSNPDNGDGVYDYLWQYRTNSSDNWIDMAATGINYQPGALNDTTYYRRKVFSGDDPNDCIDESDSIMISVLPLISKNTIDNILPLYTCYNTVPSELIGAMPEGGNNLYTYTWQDSIGGGSWTDISGTDLQSYTPLALTNPTFFRRKVVSSACENTSDFVKIGIWDLPIGEILDFTDTICSNIDVELKFPLVDIGEFPLNLSYLDGVNPDPVTQIISSFVDTFKIVVTPTTLNTLQNYSYSIFEIEDKNGCIATSKNGVTKITTYGNPVSDAGLYTENCSHQFVLEAIKSLGTGVWSQISGPSTAIFETIDNPASKATVTESGNYTYQWKEVNWECKDSAEVDLFYYLPVENVNAGNDTTLFYVNEYDLHGSYSDPDYELNLNGVSITTLWQEVSNTGAEISPDNSLDAIISPLSDPDNTGILVTFTVNKGQACEAVVDTVVISLQELHTPNGFTPNGDGINDYLKFKGLENASSSKLLIFNRWGAEVYNNDNFTNEPGWDGKNEDGYELPEDTYFYILETTNWAGKNEVYKGYIVIKRG